MAGACRLAWPSWREVSSPSSSPGWDGLGASARPSLGCVCAVPGSARAASGPAGELSDVCFCDGSCIRVRRPVRFHTPAPERTLLASQGRPCFPRDPHETVRQGHRRATVTGKTTIARYRMSGFNVGFFWLPDICSGKIVSAYAESTSNFFAQLSYCRNPTFPTVDS